MAHKRVWPVTNPEDDERVGAALRLVMEKAGSVSFFIWTIEDDGLVGCQARMVVDGQVQTADQDTLLATLQQLTGTIDMKMCMKCGKTKKLGEFAHNKRQRDGYATRCKLCEAARMMALSAARRAAKSQPKKPRFILTNIGKTGKQKKVRRPYPTTPDPRRPATRRPSGSNQSNGNTINSNRPSA